MAATVMVGSIACPLDFVRGSVTLQKVKKRILVPKTSWKTVCMPVEVESTQGCTSNCAGLRGYSKTSLARAVREGDLTRAMRCPTCGLLARVGEARDHVVKRQITEFKRVEETIMVEEEIEVDEPAVNFIQDMEVATVRKFQPPHASIAPSVMAKMPFRSKSVLALKREGDQSVKERERKAEEVFQAFFSKPEIASSLERKKFGKIVRTGLGLRIQPASKEQVACKLIEAREMNKLEEMFYAGELEDYAQPGKVMILDCVVRGEQVSFASPFYTRTLKTKKRKPNCETKLKLPSNQIEVIMKELCERAREGRSIEFIHQRKERMKACYKKFSGNTIACVSLAHMKGVKIARELKPRAFDYELSLLMEHNQIKHALRNEDIIRGFSGAVLPREVVGYTARNFQNFVVRGRCDGKLIDARCKLSYHMRHRMEHYAEKEFWTGWKKVFDKTAPVIDHACVSDITNEQCGELAAGIFQRMHPCKRISCLACRRTIEDLDRDDYFEFINKNAKSNHAVFWKVGNQYASANVVLNNIDQTMHVNPEIETLMEITRILQGHSASQMQHLVNIHTALLKGTIATSDDLSLATKSLLEVARWFKNHLSQMEKGDVAVFRNKASSKTSINFSLLCDNQLDRNGNFVWGERGRHSKRFFSNFFEEVKPGDGYVNLIERKHPSGSRKLAIGHLVVPLDLDRVRNALEGEPVDLKPISQSCISKSSQSFEYTCCCVTNDKGAPFYSSIKSPTKSHLVIGNTGDAKYVDLPTFETERMYVAKEGYCYVNIFLAMLVNVNEDSAKDFTKRVRDVFIPMLGKWPTMYDLAAVCYILTIFHPETRSAELPRILVDHDNQMMHVIDSFGSLNTGYHVLKAGTVQQLLPFARKSLEGEMKHYRVGGDFDKIRRNRMELMLIKSIYRPKRMIKIIEDDPYVLFLCLVTPKLITALYNTGGLDRAMEYWVDRDTNLSTAFAMLSYLAKRVSRVDFIKEQIESISNIAQKLSDLLRVEGVQAMSRNEVMMFIESIASRSIVDAQMVKNGFVSFEASLFETREKIYSQKLSSAWKELSLLEKFCAMRSFYFQRRDTIDVLIEPDTSKVEAKYEISCTWFCNKIQEAQSGVRRYFQGKISACSDYARRTVIQRISQIINRCFSDVFYMINVLLLISMFTSIITFIKQYFDKAREAKWNIAYSENRCKMHEIESMYSLFVKAHGVPTEKEFYRYVYEFRPDLCEHIEKMYTEVELQSKTYIEQNFERIIAFMALITMMFDEKKSDIVFKVLSKIKTVFNSFENVVRLQGIDEIESIEDEKKETVDFSLKTEELSSFGLAGSRFEDWWRNQLEQNRVVPHYRLTGSFLEFTRETLAQVCNTINTSSEREFLIRGAVGSGKSTGLPNQLSKKGRVLLLEPTRPLAENVCKQLRKEPFYNNATLRMRGLNSFGSSNVTVMTSGFALHYYAHNQAQLEDYAFIIIDECHVIDSSAMAFYCLLMEYSYPGKILRVSATPPGRECDFKTQFPVKIKIEDHASFNDFVAAQGTKCNMDVIQDGDNILVYVASYNDVDSLSKQLIDNGFMVTKVDGRTMKLGGVEIITRGNSTVKHFIVATNIIENGVTLDVDVVVDFGLKVQAELDSDLRSMKYSKIPISYGERIQRLGRVGRVKPGTALRIGHTEKGVSEIPVCVATEAAFICFAYGLPVMSHNVTLSVLSLCSVPQAKTMLNFELPCFFMVDLVSQNGNMHPLIHDELKKFKLRDSAITLNKLAIPNASVHKWISVHDYNRYGIKIHIDESVKIPFHSNNIPDLLYERIWKVVCDNKNDAGFGCLKLANACKIAYTLSIDSTVLPKTVGIIDALIQQEMEKKAHFENMTSALTNHSFSLQGIVDRVRSRYLKDHTGHNIQVLQTVRAQIIEFSTKTHDLTRPQHLLPYGFLDVVRLEGADQIAERLGLKGIWNGGLMTQDVVIMLMISIGGAWMIWDYFKSQTQDVVLLHGKRRTQKLKFREARDKKVGREVYCDDGTMEQTFGEAYTKRGKVKGNNGKRGMGNKTRNFVHLYGFDPTEYSFVRFLDPLTGATIDDTPHADLNLIQDEFGDIRRQAILDDNLSKEKLVQNPGIRAYFTNPKTHKAIKVDLHPHNPLAVCRNVSSIAGFPEHEFELRQTGVAKQIDISEVPKEKESVALEGKSILRGPRDYNPIARSVCQVVNSAEGHKISMYAIGYGSILIAPGHLFKYTGGSFEVSTYMGVFKVHNAGGLKIHHLKGRDLILIRMPKDFPPFPQRLRFRHPIDGEKSCMVSSIFQQKSMSSSVSETTVVMPTEGCYYWKHWISSSEGSCGLPLVSTKDGFILGIHGLGGCVTDKNYFVTIPENFEKEILCQMDEIEWSEKWRYNIDKILWGRLCYAENEADSIFKINKYARDLSMVGDDLVKVQGSSCSWILNELTGNLKAVAEAESHLVTKHVIKGRCEYFTRYLNENDHAREFFQPLMGHYGPSKLNKEAFKKDFFKYTPAIEVGQVDITRFEMSVEAVKNLLIKLDFGECKFITDPQEILDSLNLKSSVGAMFKGKKKEYLESFSEFEREALVEKSCLRLFLGKMGIWNGSLKAELRHVDKLAANKTRTFTAAPIDTLLGAKVCVDDFNNRFYSLNCKGPWTVGMTKFYKGWDNFLQSLPDGWIYCHADGSRFDSSLTPYLINAVVVLRDYFMEDWWVGKEMLRNLYTEVVYTPILTPDGTIVKKFKGNNSGQPSTVVDNTLMVVIAMYYALSKEVPDLDVCDEFIKFYANGDDLVIAIDPSKEHLLDGFATSFDELGLNYVFTERSVDRCSIEYMSHVGLLRDGLYIPKLDKERIVSILEWDRSKEIAHRAEAICASMIEAWGYDDLLMEIRKFYDWLMNQAEFKDLAAAGTFPYISETALRKLYTDHDVSINELFLYWEAMMEEEENEFDVVILQGDRSELDAGASAVRKKEPPLQIPPETSLTPAVQDRDVDTGSRGQIVPRIKLAGRKMRMPKIKNAVMLDLEHLLGYKPEQVDLSNTRATHKQFEAWCTIIKEELEITDEQMKVVLNGFMVWCIENGTSPNMNGVWTMMEGDEQIEFPLKPFVENAKPTLRQIMHHFSDAAEAYIELRNAERVYIPRYALIRNLRDASLARFAFDFYEMHAKTPVRAREAHLQMKAAALSNVSTRMFGLDGNVATQEENTERHVATDVNANMHTLLGVRHT